MFVLSPFKYPHCPKWNVYHPLSPYISLPCKYRQDVATLPVVPRGAAAYSTSTCRCKTGAPPPRPDKCSTCRSRACHSFLLRARSFVSWHLLAQSPVPSPTLAIHSLPWYPPLFLPSLLLPLLFTTTSPSFLNFPTSLVVLGNVGFRSLLHCKKIRYDFVS